MRIKTFEGMHGIIRSEIEHIISILKTRGFREPIVERGPDVEVIKDVEVSQLFQKRPTWVVRVNPEDVADTNYAGIFPKKLRDCRLPPVDTSSRKVQSQSWCAVLFNPSDYPLWIKITLLTSWLREKEFQGFILLEYPGVASNGDLHTWDRKLLFIRFNKDGTYKASKAAKIQEEDEYPWLLKRAPQKCSYINSCTSKVLNQGHEKKYYSLTDYYKDNPSETGTAGMVLTGKVVTVESDHAVLRFSDGQEGILYKMDFGWSSEFDSMHRLCPPKSEIEVKVLLLRGDKLVLGRKHRFTDPWIYLSDLNVNDKYQGIIKSCRKTKIYVGIGEPYIKISDPYSLVIGYIPIPSNVRNKVRSDLKKGMTINVAIKEMDIRERKLILQSDDIWEKD